MEKGATNVLGRLGTLLVGTKNSRKTYIDTQSMDKLEKRGLQIEFF